VREASCHHAGLGALQEDQLLRGDYQFPALAGLQEQDQKVLLGAVTVLFVEHNVCFRERLGATTLLVFPDLIQKKKPRLEADRVVEDVSYRVVGNLDNLYASLVVRLGYTQPFTQTDQWENQAQYEVEKGEICGFRQIAEREGEIDFVLYYAERVPDGPRHLFQGLFEIFLRTRDVGVTQFPPVRCQACGYQQDRATVVGRILGKYGQLFCANCGKDVPLPAAGKKILPTPEERKCLEEQEKVTHRRTRFEADLVKVKRLVQDRRKRAPRCFLSYAWGVQEHEKWVLQLAEDLRKAGIEVVLDRWHNPPGTEIVEFIEKIESSDRVVPVGTPELLKKYKARKVGPVVAAELRLIGSLLTKRSAVRRRVIPVLLEGTPERSFPALLRNKVFADFREEEKYFDRLLELVWILYGLPPGSLDVAALPEAGSAGQEQLPRTLA
jgi:hypothetical protein